MDALTMVAALIGPGMAAAGEPDPPRPTSRTVRQIEGWTVRIDDRLLQPGADPIGARALRFLEYKLGDIRSVVAPERLAKLQSFTIVIDRTHGKLRAMQYHPDAGWLKENGYSPDLVKCVHIPEAADLPTPRSTNEQPWVVLHELAHAYHDQVLGFDEPRILEAYERFKRSGHGDKALLYDGKRVRHYGLTDHKEFFAEMTEAYFGMNDFFPFNCAELMTAEPEIYELMRAIWEPVTPGGAGKAADPLGGAKSLRKASRKALRKASSWGRPAGSGTRSPSSSGSASGRRASPSGPAWQGSRIRCGCANSSRPSAARSASRSSPGRSTGPERARSAPPRSVPYRSLIHTIERPPRFKRA